MSTSLRTQAGQGISFSVPASYDITGATLSAEYSSNSRFTHVVLTKTPVATGRMVALTLSAAEVDTIQDCYFRVLSTLNGRTTTVHSGSIDYIPKAVGVPVTVESIDQNLPVRLSDINLKSTFIPVGLASTRLRAVAIGDSTTAGNTRTTGFTSAAVNAGTSVRSYTQFMGAQGQQQAGPQSWFTYACLLSKGRLVNVYNAGLGNDRTPFMVERFGTDVIAMNPDVVFLGNAHNDFSASSGVTEAMTRSNIQTMITMARQAGIVPILVTAYPDNAPTPYGPTIRRHNVWLKKVAQEQRLLLIDLYAAVVDPTSTTGAWKAAYTTDGTHASSLGAQVAGQKVLDDLGGLLRGGPAWLPSNNVVDTGAQLVTNPLFITASGTPGLAQSWNSFGTGNTYAMGADAAVLGNAQTITFSNLSAAARLYRDGSVDGSVIKEGDRLRWAGLFKTSGAAAGSLRWYLTFQFPGIGTYEVRPLDQLVGGIDFTSWAYFEVDAVVPVGATIWRIGAYADQGSGSISLAQQGAYNLTTLGV